MVRFSDSLAGLPDFNDPRTSIIYINCTDMSSF